MNSTLGIALLALLFFTAALGFFTYSWWTLSSRLRRLAITFCAIFDFAGCVTLVFWVVTLSPPDR